MCGDERSPVVGDRHSSRGPNAVGARCRLLGRAPERISILVVSRMDDDPRPGLMAALVQIVPEGAAVPFA